MSAARHDYSPTAFLYLPADLLEALNGDHLHWNTFLPPEVDNRKMLALSLKGILFTYQVLSCAMAKISDYLTAGIPYKFTLTLI